MSQEWKRDAWGRSRKALELGGGPQIVLLLTPDPDSTTCAWGLYLKACPRGEGICFASGTSDTLEQAQEACERTARGMFLKALEGLL